MQSCINHKTSISLDQRQEQIQCSSISDFDSQSNSHPVESLQIKLASLKKELENIELKNTLLDKQRGFKHCVAFLLGF